MSWSAEWEQCYRNNTHLSVWPWSDLVSWVKRYSPPLSPQTVVLELGCGAGANIPFFLNLGVDYYAIEGSATTVARLKDRFPDLTDKIFVGDFTEMLPDLSEIDLVVDRASMTHNTTESIRRGLRLASLKIRRGGKYIGIDWFSNRHSDCGSGTLIDRWTRSNIESDQFQGVGLVHFSDMDHLVDIFKSTGFEIEQLEHTLRESSIPHSNHRMATFNICAKKI